MCFLFVFRKRDKIQDEKFSINNESHFKYNSLLHNNYQTHYFVQYCHTAWISNIAKVQIFAISDFLFDRTSLIFATSRIVTRNLVYALSLFGYSLALGGIDYSLKGF